jgi:sec-independent protein translocase protein TatC
VNPRLRAFRKRGPAPDEMPFLDHLEELRWRIIWSLVAVVVGTVVGWFIVTRLDVLGLLIAPIVPLLGDEKLGYLSPTDPFFITLRLALTVGVLLALPIVIHQIWIFLSPALLPREKKAIVPALYFGLFLFLLGVTAAYFVVLPLMFQFFAQFQQASLQQTIVVGAYLSVVVRTLLAFGVAFELPVVILVLSVLGVFDTAKLRKGRRWALVLITIGASLVTPGDILTTFFLMGPMLILYEVGILMARAVERRSPVEPDAEEPAEWAGA